VVPHLSEVPDGDAAQRFLMSSARWARASIQPAAWPLSVLNQIEGVVGPLIGTARSGARRVAPFGAVATGSRRASDDATRDRCREQRSS
jgi:hypothetical protein